MLDALNKVVPGATRRDFYSLDDAMRARLKRTCIVLTLVLATWSMILGYFVGEFAWVRQPVSLVVALIGQHRAALKDASSWLQLPLPLLIVAFLAVVYQLIVDAEKVHYQIDAGTFRAAQRVNREIVAAFVTAMRCPESDSCKIRRLRVGTREFESFKRDVFYNEFANKTTVGSYDQQTMRARVFAEWAGYYSLNFVMMFFIIAAGWLAACLVGGGHGVRLVVLAALLVAGLTAFWIVRGRRRVESLAQLVHDQIEAWQLADATFAQQVAKGRGFCPVDGCPT